MGFVLHVQASYGIQACMCAKTEPRTGSYSGQYIPDRRGRRKFYEQMMMTIIIIIIIVITFLILCRPSTSAGRDFVTENIIDSTEKQAASAAVRRKREEEARQQRERYVPGLSPAYASHIQACTVLAWSPNAHLTVS